MSSKQDKKSQLKINETIKETSDKNISVNLIDSLTNALNESNKNNNFFNFMLEENINKVIAITNVEETNNKSPFGKPIMKCDIFNENSKTFKTYFANFPSYMYTRIKNMLDNGLNKSEIILVKYLGQEKSQNIKNKTYSKYFIETLTQHNERLNE